MCSGRAVESSNSARTGRGAEPGAERPNRGRNFAFKAEWALAGKRESKEFQVERTSGQ